MFMQGGNFKIFFEEEESKGLNDFEVMLQDEDAKIQMQSFRWNAKSLSNKNKIKKIAKKKQEKLLGGTSLGDKDEIPPDQKKRGHWGQQENKKYHCFLEIYHRHFINREMRRMDKIFKIMSNFIGTRQAQQCRSHHQKMEKKYHSFIRILIHLRKEHYQENGIEKMRSDIVAMAAEESVLILTDEELSTLEEEMKDKKKRSGELNLKQYDIKENHQFGKEPEPNLFQNMLGDEYESYLDLHHLLI